MDRSFNAIIDEMKKGSVRALARLISCVENRYPGWKEIMKQIYPDTGSAKIFGITGSPGAGKSTLSNSIAMGLVGKGLSVGIIAIDPSSTFSGGAFLADRLRMPDAISSKDIFIRSLATRGMLGGLCQSAKDVARLMDAFGKDIILIETVGVGQDEIDIAKAADLVMVVCIPGQGDGIQALKSGIMEIADIFIVNKADRDGADKVESDIIAMLNTSSQKMDTIPPVLKTSALRNEGIDAVVAELLQMKDAGLELKVNEEERIRDEILLHVEDNIFQYVRDELIKNEKLETEVEKVLSRKTDPYSAAENIFTIKL